MKNIMVLKRKPSEIKKIKNGCKTLMRNQNKIDFKLYTKMQQQEVIFFAMLSAPSK